MIDQVVEFSIENGREVRLVNNCINLIGFSDSICFLPDPKGILSQIRVVFLEDGEATLINTFNKMWIGSKAAQVFKFHPGIAGFDTQPLIVFAPKKNKWIVISVGQYIFEDLKSD